jgi:hypothetical protein
VETNFSKALGAFVIALHAQIVLPVSWGRSRDSTFRRAKRGVIVVTGRVIQEIRDAFKLHGRRLVDIRAGMTFGAESPSRKCIGGCANSDEPLPPQLRAHPGHGTQRARKDLRANPKRPAPSSAVEPPFLLR